MSKTKKFTVNQRVQYIGKGFPGYKKEQPELKFLHMQGENDCVCSYSGNQVLLSLNEIEMGEAQVAAPKPKSLGVIQQQEVVKPKRPRINEKAQNQNTSRKSKGLSR